MPFKDIEARRAKGRNHYRKNKQYYIDKAGRRQEEIRLWAIGLKEGKPCTDCGIVWPTYVTQWDHLPGTEKIEDVSTLHFSGNKQKILDEIAKCELVCANCHCIRTHNRRSSASSSVE